MATSEGNSFEAFINSLNQLEQDQTLYESELGNDDLVGVQHEEIIKLGGIMSKRFQKLAEKGQSFAESLPPDFLPKLVDTMRAYQDLIMPPKVFGGFCPCLKPARSGVEYDKKFFTVKSKMVSSIFVTQSVLIENKGEQHNMDSMHYADYTNKMNKVFDFLSDIKCNVTNDKALETARKKLLTAVEHVDKFLQHFGDSAGNVEFKAEALRRIRNAQELLSNRQVNADGVALPIGRRVLIKAQSSLQEIMNSAAAIASTKARENLQALEGLQKLLKKSRDIEVNQFNSMEEDMNELNIIDSLSRLREDSEVLHSDANSKLRDATKRWNTIKAQAVPRKVAEYREDLDSGGGGLSTSLSSGAMNNPDFHAQKLLQGTGNKIKNAGRFAEKLTKEAVTGVGGVVGEVRSFAQNSANEVKNNMKKVGTVFIGDDNASVGSSGSTSYSNSNNNNNGNSKAKLQRNQSARTATTSNNSNPLMKLADLSPFSGSESAAPAPAAPTTTAGRMKARLPKIDLDAF